MSTIKIGITDKRKNSTKSSFVSGSDTTLSCVMKEPIDYHDPIFKVIGLTKNVMYNYAQWGDYLYHVNSVKYITNDIAEISCTLDPMATYKNAVSRTYGYMLYSSDSSKMTSYVDDERVGPDHKLTWTPGEGSKVMDGASMGLSTSNGSVIVVVQASTSFAYSSMVTYAMTPAVYRRMLKAFSGVVYSDCQSWSSTDFIDIAKNYATRILTGGVQAMDNIISATYIPIPYDTFKTDFIIPGGNEYNFIVVGPYQVSLDSGDKVCCIMPDATSDGVFQMQLGKPLPNTVYSWLNAPKYRSIKLTHPCGFVDISDPALNDSAYAYAWWALNPASGDYQIRVTSENSKESDTITQVSGNVGVDVLGYTKTGSNGSTDANLHNGILTALTGGLTGGLLPYNAGSCSPGGGGSSTPNGFAGLTLLKSGWDIFYDIEYYQPAIFEGNDSSNYNNFCAKYGYPVHKYYKVSDMASGSFIQFVNASVDFNGASLKGATESDKAIINNYLNSGFYYE